MKGLFVCLLLTFVNRQIVAKQYGDCELTEELYSKHNVSLSRVHIHLCIATRKTSTQWGSDNEMFLGLYRIGRWWCGKGKVGGGCNLNCDSLIDEDISDDLRCAEHIIKVSGIKAWGQTLLSCNMFFEIAHSCLNIDLEGSAASTSSEE